MAARFISGKTVLATSDVAGGWFPGTLYVHEDDVRFDAGFGFEAFGVTPHLKWSEVSEIRWRAGGVFGSVEVVHRQGVQRYRCFGAAGLLRLLRALHAERKTQVEAEARQENDDARRARLAA